MIQRHTKRQLSDQYSRTYESDTRLCEEFGKIERHLASYNIPLVLTRLETICRSLAREASVVEQFQYFMLRMSTKYSPIAKWALIIGLLEFLEETKSRPLRGFVSKVLLDKNIKMNFRASIMMPPGQMGAKETMCWMVDSDNTKFIIDALTRSELTTKTLAHFIARDRRVWEDCDPRKILEHLPLNVLLTFNEKLESNIFVNNNLVTFLKAASEQVIKGALRYDVHASGPIFSSGKNVLIFQRSYLPPAIPTEGSLHFEPYLAGAIIPFKVLTYKRRKLSKALGVATHYTDTLSNLNKVLMACEIGFHLHNLWKQKDVWKEFYQHRLVCHDDKVLVILVSLIAFTGSVSLMEHFLGFISYCAAVSTSASWESVSVSPVSVTELKQYVTEKRITACYDIVLDSKPVSVPSFTGVRASHTSFATASLFFISSPLATCFITGNYELSRYFVEKLLIDLSSKEVLVFKRAISTFVLSTYEASMERTVENNVSYVADESY